MGRFGTRELSFVAPADRTFVVNAAALRNHGGTVVVFHDITRLKQLENLRKEFVANVSHELRTPVSVIRGYIETLLEKPAPDAATARQFQETIQKHARQLEALIEDLLNISALESHQARLEFEPVALAEVAAAATEQLRRQARDKNIAIAVDLPTTLPSVRCDRQRLQQVFVNLLDNAIKYTQAGGRVGVSAQVAGTELEVSVADNGPGIAAEHLPRIFERFYRVDKARSRELGGTGLGLSIVKHIVLAHGGRVWVDSTVGHGSRFYFTLPVAG
jgi:two-component system phosphate regulon sensor histidine kinase PhoR